LVAPRGAATRPTSDRVREALFMALEPLRDLRVVDLFAGSGALGIEALSRGAEHVDFVERRGQSLAALRENLATLDLNERATVWTLDLDRGLRPLRGRLASAQLVLMDPPYGGGLARKVLAELGAPGVLRAGARVVAEHHAKDEIMERAGSLERVRERRYGETMVSTYVCGDRSQGG
jgi:16S rRNA (guanine966-N2)-methyltransferase